MYTKEYIEEIIECEFHDKSHVKYAITIFNKLIQRQNNNQNLSIYEISNLLNSNVGNDELYRITFELSSLSTPVFSLIVFLNYDAKVFEIEKEDIYKIFGKNEIISPLTGDVLLYSEYKDMINIFFKSNDFLIELIKQNLKTR